jgi:hypothetical protein
MATMLGKRRARTLSDREILEITAAALQDVLAQHTAQETLH